MRLRVLVPALFLVFGTGFLTYPEVSDGWNRLHQSQAIARYETMLRHRDTGAVRQMLLDAEAYNRALFLGEEPEHPYEELLNAGAGGMMGWISVPELKIRLPLYHGTDSGVLQVGAGHLRGSSLPVGGENTHAVISGHTGLASAKLFTGLDRMEKGSLFYVEVPGRELCYRVESVETVLPEDTEHLAIVPGRDIVTLVTCTPYGVNTHRLLVHGSRDGDPGGGREGTPSSGQRRVPGTGHGDREPRIKRREVWNALRR